MAQTADVQNGLGLWSTWVDYNQLAFMRRKWTLSTSAAGILTSFVAVVLALAAPRLFLAVQRVYDQHLARAVANPPEGHVPGRAGAHGNHVEQNLIPAAVEDPRRDSSDVGAAPQSRSSTVANTPSNAGQSSGANPHDDRAEGHPPDERSSLLPSSASRIQSNSLSKAFMRRESPQGTALEVFTSAFDRSHTWREVVFRLSIAFLCILFFIAITIMAIYSAWIATQPITLSDSKDCGLWILDQSVNFLSRFNYMQEKEAGDYATRCYNTTVGADGCNFFTTRSLPFEEKDHSSCPFARGFCLEEDNAYTLSTGLVSSKELGINVPVGYTFNRTATCSPIQRKGYWGIDEDYDLIEYYYGPLGGLSPGNTTWVANPNLPPWSGPGYQVDTFCSLNTDGGWQPIPEFLPADNPEMTLMLVSSQRNFHMERRTDPIFPATSMLLVGSAILYLNRDYVATVLACTDKTTICDANGEFCWNAFDDPLSKPKDEAESNGLFMLQMALLRSRICFSALYRGGTALDATPKLFVYQSLPLAKEQWKVEAKHLFATSLARMQVDLRDHMRGTAAHEPGFVNMLSRELRGVCNQYKFKSNGWTNISVWGFVCAMVVSLLVFILTYQIKTPVVEGNMKSDKLFVEVLFYLVSMAWVGLKKLPKKWFSSAKRGNSAAGGIINLFNRPRGSNTTEDSV